MTRAGLAGAKHEMRRSLGNYEEQGGRDGEGTEVAVCESELRRRDGCMRVFTAAKHVAAHLRLRAQNEEAVPEARGQKSGACTPTV